MRRIVILLPVCGLLAILMLLVLHRPIQVRHRPSSLKFRSYLADSGSRMVAYSPTAEVLRDGTHRALRGQLAALRGKFDGLSLYQSSPEAPAIVEAAEKLGYKAVLLTVWDPRSEPELATASSIVRSEGGAMALAVSLGSEGLMQKRYTFTDLQNARSELQERAAGNTTVEMTTTEPWWLYKRPDEQSLRDFGEFTSINIHVVWDTDIQDPALAASWTRDRAAEVQEVVRHPVLLREAGFPGAGTSPRNTSRLTFTRELQAGFWRSWLALQTRTSCVFFEGYDNPQKHWRDFESSWGLLDSDSSPWPAWRVIPTL